MVTSVYEPRDVSLPALLAASIERGDATTISFDHVPYRAGDLLTDASALADALSAVLGPGERLLVMARNSREALLSWWAARLLNAIVVPINVANRSSILEHQIRDSDPVVAVVHDEFAEIMQEALESVGLRLRLVLEVGGEHAWERAADESTAFDRAIKAGSASFSFVNQHQGPSHLIYTAGTTGPSKACMVGDQYLFNMASQMNHNLAKQPGETLWTAMPIFHLAAVTHTVGAILIDGSISLAQRFSVRRFWEDVWRSGASYAALMGTMIPMIGSAPGNDYAQRCIGQLRTVSGSPVTPEMAKVWQERFGVPRIGSGAYGMTEAALITSSPADEYRVGSAGRVNESFDVQIIDEHERPVPTGEVGQIVCRPCKPGIMFQGYWRDPDKTLSVMDNLWFHTGDFGRLDEDGYLYFVDRGKDYLRKGGENISSFEIEQIFVQHPSIEEVAVHAVPGALSEDEVKVTAVLVQDTKLNEEQLFSWSKEWVPRYAWPMYIEFRSQLPKNPVGRIQKFKLREQGVTPDTWSSDLTAKNVTKSHHG